MDDARNEKKVDALSDSTVRDSVDRATALRNALMDAMGRHHSVGAVSSWWNGSELVTAEVGLVTIGEPAPVKPTTLFALGSVTKLLTAFMVLQLIDEGRFSLDDRVVQLLPEFRYHDEGVAERVTVRQLLTHSGGTPDGWPDRARVIDVLSDLADGPALCEPGWIASYSNIGYALLGEIIERTTEKSFASNLQDRLLVPLQLENIVVLSNETRLTVGAPDHVADPVSGEIRVDDTWPRVGASMEAAGSTLYGSAPDLVRLVAAMLTGENSTDPTAPRLLSDKIAKDAVRRHVEVPGAGIVASATGLGWLHPIQPPDRHVVGHGGGTSIIVYADVDSGDVIATATNFNEGEDVGTELARELIGVPSPGPTETMRPSSADVLDRFIGEWGVGPLSNIIRREGDGLVIEVFGDVVILSEVAPGLLILTLSGSVLDLALIPGETPREDWIHFAGRALKRQA